MAQIHDLTALEQAQAVRSKELSPVEITEHYLERIERLDRELGAFVTVTAERALDQAREQEARVLREPPEDLPPLLGVPVPIKDLNLVKDVPIYFGSATYEGFVAPVDDAVVERLREAGTIMVGKTNTPEFGLPCYTEPAVCPPARTPWDLSRSAGGSSGGAAAAVAGGLAPVAHGSDGAGSIRIPASACGLYGIKPSRGRISSGPIIPDLAGFSTNGPISRTVADAAALLDAMAHNNPGDHYWAPPPKLGSFSAYVGREPGRLRIARHATPAVPEAEVHPDVLAAYEKATELLVSLGHEVEEVTPPFGAETVPEFVKMWYTFACMHPVAKENEHKLRPITAWLRERGHAVTAPEFLQAQASLQLTTRLALQATDAYDAVLTPTLTQPPVPIGWFEEGDDPEQTFERMKRFAPFTAVYNVSGQPAVNLPLHWTDEGLPIGVMLAGRFGDEGTLISLSAQIEAAVGGFWGDRRPSVW
ncbi:amidase [Thermobispora bispora]|uniref:Amidase n=1 Tax=Thermobispora bispora (strain ATCC 19993 / DSM 43833 / CBS 139.67 / JCM 10125 / KCTC 9307 / NBRC 14880 / R51) TaxID=469371 RepID=D6Y4R2_THEBD|nr:amidase [Thermobispora bispora]MBO2475444.1 amidase [Actinomycetales bacterium]MDI9581774.1 amidase [Thermobispora sp.]ADG89238.1 Amidase [Thermobispora bispora DSM 43833]MBX6166934.1 amidase [Thermobispora bispora]QSI48917.1 amidase [Thermobispora bispora]